MGLNDFKNLVVFNSLSKRSNVPGLRSGFIAGDAEIIQKFLILSSYTFLYVIGMGSRLNI